ncbi:MAG: CDP-diacylglycerol--glycerol-3-phosphate 3-phosphatidyltransferase [Asticcacaulis sp.]
MTGEKPNPIPNLLTALRLVAGLVMFLLMAATAGGLYMFSPAIDNRDLLDSLTRLAFYAFVIAAVTDFFDGYLARRMHAESEWGAILDPIADKILVCGTILGLFSINPQPEIALPAAIILFREFAVSALREASAGKGIRIPVSLLAKWKTTVQLVALGAQLLVQSWTAFGLDVSYLTAFSILAFWLMWLAALITLWTGIVYFWGARKSI